MRMCLVVNEFEIFKFEIKDVFHLGIDLHLRESIGFAGELKPDLIQMVVVDMCITKSMDEISGLESGYLGHHQGEQGIGSNVEWNAQKHIRTSLVQLARQLSVINVKLEKQVARR